MLTLKERRNALNLKQRELADLLGIERSVVSKWEAGEFLPSSPNVIKLAKLYRCTTDEILGHSLPPSGQPDAGE